MLVKKCQQHVYQLSCGITICQTHRPSSIHVRHTSTDVKSVGLCDQIQLNCIVTIKDFDFKILILA